MAVILFSYNRDTVYSSYSKSSEYFVTYITGSSLEPVLTPTQTSSSETDLLYMFGNRENIQV